MPRVIYTDKLRAYLEGVERVFGAETVHRQGGPFNVEDNTNLIERFHGTLKSRTKVMRGLHTIGSARRFMDGWLVHYNYFRPHMSLNDLTPAQAAGLTSFPFRNWRDVCEQPYEITARIPMPEKSVAKANTLLPVRHKRLVRRRSRRTDALPSLSQTRK